MLKNIMTRLLLFLDVQLRNLVGGGMGGAFLSEWQSAMATNERNTMEAPLHTLTLITIKSVPRA